MSDSAKSILFAAIMCIVCSTLLTAAMTGLQGFQQKNMKMDRQKNILKSVGLLSRETDLSEKVVTQLYQENIKSFWATPDGVLEPTRDPAGSWLPLYVHLQNERIQSYIIPIVSKGLWGRIYGYLAIDRDGETVKGFTVYKHQETPGLGGEIEKRWFQKNFVDKKILGRDGNFVSIGIAKGKVETSIPVTKQLNYVDGISGATLTGKYLTEGLRKVLSEYEPVSVRFRNNRILSPTADQ